MKKRAMIIVSRDELRSVMDLKDGVDIINTSCNEYGDVVVILGGDSLPSSCTIMQGKPPIVSHKFICKNKEEPGG